MLNVWKNKNSIYNYIWCYSCWHAARSWFHLICIFKYFCLWLKCHWNKISVNVFDETHAYCFLLMFKNQKCNDANCYFQLMVGKGMDKPNIGFTSRKCQYLTQIKTKTTRKWYMFSVIKHNMVNDDNINFLSEFL